MFLSHLGAFAPPSIFPFVSPLSSFTPSSVASFFSFSSAANSSGVGSNEGGLGKSSANASKSDRIGANLFASVIVGGKEISI
jgi:hypothetical protein